MTDELFLGIDAGGTKTHAVIADARGRVLGVGRAGTGNWEGVGLAGAYHALAEALGQALAESGIRISDLHAGGYGLAGLDWPSDEERLGPIVAQLGVPGPQVLVNDAFAALSAGSADGCGVAAIAGTGTTVAGRNRRGETFRSFGLGYIWGDFGAAGDIVRAALRATSLAHFGRGERTALTDRFLEHYGTRTFDELVEQVSREQAAPPDGRLAPLVFEVAAVGDAVAQEVIRQCGAELGQNVAAIARRLGMHAGPFDLVMAGGVFRSRSALFRDALVAEARATAPQVHPVELQAPPVVGAVLLAMRALHAGVPAEARQRLCDEAAARLGI